MGMRRLPNRRRLGPLLRDHKPGNPNRALASILTRITCPIALLSSYPLSLYSVLFANAATYALVGTIVETLRRTGNQNHPA